MSAKVVGTRVTRALIAKWPLPLHADSGGKEDRGRVLVIGGSISVPGAVVLAGEAALRAGAGKLQVATPELMQGHVAMRLLEAKVSGLPTDKRGELHRTTHELERDLAAADGVLLGPGMGPGRSAERLASAVSLHSKCPVVLDAGALDIFLGKPDFQQKAVLTPHMGEMAHLLSATLEEVEAEPQRIAYEFARRMGAVVVLKGSTTYICDCGEGSWVHTAGSVGLGTSGSGDVLSGVIAGLIARGAQPHQAAVWGVYLHGRAGARLAKRLGPLGFLAGEIAAEIPALMATHAS